MVIKNVFDTDFKQYGRVIKEVNNKELSIAMLETPCPDDTIYVPSDDKLEKLDAFNILKDGVFGGMDIQIGYCNGHNNKLNGLEYHRNSEINFAVNDLILLLGKQQDIEDDYTYNTENAEAFLVPAGTMVEVYATTLHYAPCGVDGEGFRCVVVLPRGTNTEAPAKQGLTEDKLLMAKNKWLIAHADACIEGAFNGLKGINIEL